MKKILLTMWLILAAVHISAVPARRGFWKTLTLTDGTSVQAELRGDAFNHFYQDEEGNRFIQAEASAYFRLVSEEELAARAASNPRHRAAASHRAPRRIDIGPEYLTTPITGTHNELIILVNFTDSKFMDTHTRQVFDDLANKENYVNTDFGFSGSVSDYFKSMSDGKFTMHFDVVGPIDLTHNYAYYGKNDTYYNQDEAPEKMIVEAIKAVDADVDFSKYDNDGDGKVDQVFVLYAGMNESAGGDANTVYPHKFNLSYSPTTGYQAVTLDNVQIDDYACSSELTWYGYNQTGDIIYGISGLGVICHEFSHCLGLPDIYDTAYQNYGMNTWDIMDAGEWNGLRAPGFNPPEYTAYERMFCGWRKPIELTADTLVRGMKPISQGGETFIIRNKANPHEYYLLENRQLDGWDIALEAIDDYQKLGLLVSHVDYDAKVWEYNEVNNTASDNQTKNKHPRMQVVAADNSYGTEKVDPITKVGYYDYADVQGDLYPSGKNDSLTNFSSPRANLYNNNTDGRKLLNVAITHITQNADGTIDFDFKANTGLTGDQGNEVFFYESFDQCNGKGGNDGDWGSNASIGSSTLRTDNEGWMGTPSNGSGADKCAKFGSSRSGSVSSALTPVFAINGGATLTFMVAPWQGDGNNLTLEVFNDEDLSNTFTLSDSRFTMVPGKWNTFTTTITGTGNLQIRFKADKRFFLDEVRVEGLGTGIRETFNNKPSTVNPQSSILYTIDGRQATKHQHGIVIQDGKKQLR